MISYTSSSSLGGRERQNDFVVEVEPARLLSQDCASKSTEAFDKQNRVSLSSNAGQCGFKKKQQTFRAVTGSQADVIDTQAETIRQLEQKLRKFSRHRKFDMSKLPEDLLKFQQLSQDFRVRLAVQGTAGCKDLHHFGDQVVYVPHPQFHARAKIIRVNEDTYDVIYENEASVRH